MRRFEWYLQSQKNKNYETLIAMELEVMLKGFNDDF